MKCDLRWVTIWPFIIHRSWEPVAHQWGETTASQKVGALAATRACSSSRKVLPAPDLDRSGSVVRGQVGSTTAMCFWLRCLFPQWSAATWRVAIRTYDGRWGSWEAICICWRFLSGLFIRVLPGQFSAAASGPPVEFKPNENSSPNNNAACFRTKINLNNSASHCAIPHRLKYAKTQSSLGRLHTLRL